MQPETGVEIAGRFQKTTSGRSPGILAL